MPHTTTTTAILPTINVASACDCSLELAIDEARELTVAEFDALFNALGEDCSPAGGYAKVRWSVTLADGTTIGTRLDPSHAEHDLAADLEAGAFHYTSLARHGGHGNTPEACKAFAAGYAELAKLVHQTRAAAELDTDAEYLSQLEAFLEL